jgi:uncharacterized RDD family membrane protein YckC
MSAMTDMPEGWYTDPAAANPQLPTTMRYWDGRQWTAQVRAAKRNELAAWRQQVAVARMEMAAAQSTQVAPGEVVAGYPPEQVVGEWASRDFTPDGQQLAGWWSRVGAAVIDWILTTVLTVLFGWGAIQDMVAAYRSFMDLVVQASEAGAPMPDTATFVDQIGGPALTFSAIAIAVKLVYQVGFLKGFQATPGKMVLGIEVRRRVERGPLPWGTVLLRWVAQNIASLLSMVPVVGFAAGIYWLLDVLWPLWDPNRQAIHDKIARTNVVRRD